MVPGGTSSPTCGGGSHTRLRPPSAVRCPGPSIPHAHWPRRDNPEAGEAAAHPVLACALLQAETTPPEVTAQLGRPRPREGRLKAWGLSPC